MRALPARSSDAARARGEAEARCPSRTAIELDRAASARPPRARASRWRALQVAVSLGAFAFLFAAVDRAQVLAAARTLSLAHFALACALLLASTALAAARWRLLFYAFAAPHPPGPRQLLRLYFVGTFYNTFLPGGVLGDVARGVASRQAFASSDAERGERRELAGLAVVFFERVLGLSGLLLLTAGVTALRPLSGVPSLVPYGAVGLFGVGLAWACLAQIRRLVRYLPPPLARLANSVPPPQRALPVALGVAMSVAVHGLTALAGHVAVSAIDGSVAWTDSLAIVPLAMATAYLPIGYSGAGVREAAFAGLFASIGVARETAVAAALLAWLAMCCVAALGGLAELGRALSRRD